MSQDDNDRDRPTGLSRRRYLRLAAGGGVAGLAGCMGGGSGNTATPAAGTDGTDTTDGSDTGATAGGAAGTDSSDAADTSAGTGTDGTESAPSDDPTPEGGPVSDTASIWVSNVPEQSNMNQYAVTTRDTGNSYITELTAPRISNTAEIKLSGHTWDASWTDQIDQLSVPTMYTDYSVEEPFDMYSTYNQDLTYWDGTPLDANARLQEDYLYHCADGFKFDDAATFNSEVQDQWNMHRWRDKGEVEGQSADGAAGRVLKYEAVPSNQAPPHPGFTTPYYEEFQEASSEDAVSSITTELEGDTIPFSRFAEEEWGSGPYKLAPGDVSQDRMVATLRDDHPAADNITVPNLEMRLGSPDRETFVVQNGEIDVTPGTIQDEGSGSGSGLTRGTVPDYIQEYERFLQAAGDRLLMNWEQKHLQNLWVRRAIVAAIDWLQVGDNGWGPQQSVPAEYHLGLPNSLAEASFSEEFLDSLHKYPMEADIEQANQWMQKAGYTKQDGVWTHPDGTPFSLQLSMNGGIPGWIGAIQTIAASLDAAGLPTDFQTVTQSAWGRSLDAGSVSFSATIMWFDIRPGWRFYASESGGAWWSSALLGGDVTTQPATEINPNDYGETDTYGRPLDTVIPREVGSIQAPDRAGATADLEDGRQISLPTLAKSLIRPDTSEEQFQENMRLIARWYNYYLPEFTFHQYRWGMIGNVRDFQFPPESHTANRVQKPSPGGTAYTTLAGLSQAKYDEGYPTPGGDG